MKYTSPDEYERFDQAATNVQARLAIELSDLVKPMAETLAAAVKVGTGEDCDGEGLYDCLVASNWDGGYPPFVGPCAEQTGCTMNLFDMSQDEQQ